MIAGASCGVDEACGDEVLERCVFSTLVSRDPS